MSLVVETYAGSATEWDAFVSAQPRNTHFHRHGWRGVFERVFAHRCPYLAARSADGVLEGVLPLVHVRSVLFGHHLMSLPYVNYGGPLGSPTAVRALAAAAVQQARTARVRLLELRSRAEQPIDLRVSQRKITVTMPLAPDAEAQFKRFDAKLRSQVRRPQKEGLTVRFGLDQVDAFHAVFSRHMRDLGTPAQPRSLFRAIAAAFPEDAWFGCVYAGERPVACGAGFRWDDEFEMTWASSLAEFKRESPNMLLYWEFMRRCIGAGVTTFNFGRCTPGGGTHRFKAQWGGVDEPLWWYQDSLRGETVGTPAPGDGAYAWGPRLWKHLPLPVASALGPLVVRGIP